jgi:hypothetical protein
MSLIYIFICIVIGFIGSKRKFGFWGYFFGSMILTPPIGLILVLASDKRLTEQS